MRKNISYAICFLAIFIFNASATFAESYNFSGKIIDESSDEPIYGALVELIVDGVRIQTITSDEFG